MLKLPRYAEQWKAKEAWYKSHGIASAGDPGATFGILVTSEDDARGGIDSQEIEKKARAVLGIDA
jgi:hypothetical protein